MAGDWIRDSSRSVAVVVVAPTGKLIELKKYVIMLIYDYH